MIDSSRYKAVGSESQLQLKNFEPSQIGHRAEDATLLDDIKTLFRTLANLKRFSSSTEAITSILQVYCQRIGIDKALVVQPISDQVFELKAVYDPTGNLFVGQHIPTAWLQVALRHQTEALIIDNEIVHATTNASHLAYNLVEISAYVGIALPSLSTEGGAVSFFSSKPIRALDKDDIVLLELVAEGIACMTDIQSARAQRKTEDLAIYASGSLKSLDEYRASAELPDGLGISGKVVEVLKRRIGQSSLSIDNIAEELNLSKRTLQRRLQQQGISFAELRDRVRFHYSIDFLVKQQVSIDRISSTLDFSDRTSFTNAFKRWTGLSPSTFRKVFRDYV